MVRILPFLFLVVLTGTWLASDFYTPFAGGPAMAQAQDRPNFFQRLFGGGRKKERPEKAPQKEEKNRKRRTGASQSDDDDASRKARKNATAALPKIDDANRVVVIGDATAGAIALGLTEAYKRTPSVLISSRIEDDISIAGDRFYPWLDASDFTFLGERVKAVVVALGTHDRSAVVAANEKIPFGAPEWERAYRRRLVDVSAQLQQLNIPVIWVLPPPLIDDAHSELSAKIATIQKNALEPLNFRIVDVAGGFLNLNGKYSSVGANISGERVGLRDEDGIGFTKSGAGKLAYYVQREIDSILDETLNQVLKLEPGAQLKRSPQQIVTLTRPALVQGAVLAGGNGRASAFYRDARARDYFIAGKAPEAPRGRVDNFSWPDSALPPEEELTQSVRQTAR